MKTKSFVWFISAFILMLFYSGCTHRPADRSMSGWDHMMGSGGYGGMFMWIVLIVIAAVIIYFVINRSKTTGNSINATRESPTDILKKRYAKGEITKEEFEALRKETEVSSVHVKYSPGHYWGLSAWLTMGQPFFDLVVNSGFCGRKP
ncbi:MAG: SHOCT domain-containing protein [Deltaproteobacteria bacterium]|nr:SHOCT domain-containing protein [Deltaproteobacteria bacterium]